MDRSGRERLAAITTPHPRYDDLVCVEADALREAGIEEAALRQLMNETGGWIEAAPEQSARFFRRRRGTRFVLRRSALAGGGPTVGTIRRIEPIRR